MIRIADPPAIGVAIPPRLHAELCRRLRELEARCPAAMKPGDRRELQNLKDLLLISPPREGDNGRSSI